MGGHAEGRVDVARVGVACGIMGRQWEAAAVVVVGSSNPCHGHNRSGRDDHKNRVPGSEQIYGRLGDPCPSDFKKKIYKRTKQRTVNPKNFLQQL